MNDINWRPYTDENIELLRANPSEQIIINTEISIRTCWARYYDFATGFQKTFGSEKLIEFAFMGTPDNT